MSRTSDKQSFLIGVKFKAMLQIRIRDLSVAWDWDTFPEWHRLTKTEQLHLSKLIPFPSSARIYLKQMRSIKVTIQPSESNPR